MITLDHAMDGSVTEFHIARSSLSCTVWNRCGIAYSMPDRGFFLPVDRAGDDGREWHHITGVTAADWHVAADCPNIRSDEPPVPPGPVLALSDRSEDGYDIWGYDERGYDRNGYDSDGFDSGGYDADGFDANGYDADGDPRPGSIDASDLDLADLWNTHTPRSPWHSSAGQREFRDHLRALVADPDEIDSLAFCEECGEPGWDDDMSSAANGSVTLCQSCWDDWSTCDHCEERYSSDDMNGTLGDEYVCDSCRDNYYSWCDECDGYYPDEDASDHDHDSSCGGCCESPQQEFTVRNDGDVPLANDRRITIELPAGTISAEGLTAIRDYLFRQSYGIEHAVAYRQLAYGLEELGDEWQTRTGNYVKRLSRHAYQEHQLKLGQDAMSNIGNIAREHSTAVSVAIEVTRNLNLPAYEFYHEDSCWWGSYSESRCTLKTNGGFGLRSFDDGTNNVSGRAWVLPLRKRTDGEDALRGPLTPTFETMTPDAFVVFNGYGDLSGYAPARIIAHMAGWTYRKIDFTADPMYVNAGGYLIAPEELAKDYTDGDLRMNLSQHSRLFQAETETARELVNA